MYASWRASGRKPTWKLSPIGKFPRRAYAPTLAKYSRRCRMPREKVILAYSGGLDTSVMVPWIGEKYGLDVVTFTVDLGQGEDIQKIREKATRTGAVDAVAVDARN